MLDARVARLETDVGEIKADIKGIRAEMTSQKIEMAEIKGKISMLPGYGGIALIVGLMVGISTMAQIAAKLLQ